MTCKGRELSCVDYPEPLCRQPSSHPESSAFPAGPLARVLLTRWPKLKKMETFLSYQPQSQVPSGSYMCPPCGRCRHRRFLAAEGSIPELSERCRDPGGCSPVASGQWTEASTQHLFRRAALSFILWACGCMKDTGFPPKGDI